MNELQTELQTAPKRVPMDLAASLVSELCEKIDNGADLDQELIAAFDDTKLALAAAVDRRIAFDAWIKGAQEAAREARDSWNDRLQLLKRVHAKFKENTLAIVQASPDIPFSGSLGKIRVQKNPPGVQLLLGEKELTPEVIEMMGIDDRFIRKKTEYWVDVSAVKEALAAGEDIPWATISNGYHVRFTK